MAETYPGRLILGLDARDGRVATAGLARRLEHPGTDLGPGSSTRCRWPASSTPTSRATARSKAPTWRRSPPWPRPCGRPVIASGGVGELDDLERLAALPHRGVHRRPRLVRGPILAAPTRSGGARRSAVARGGSRSTLRAHVLASQIVLNNRDSDRKPQIHRSDTGRIDAMTTTYHIADIRNVALAGHGASGKTSLADALLFAAGATSRKGSVDDGTSTLDVDEEEKRRHFTIDCHLGHLAWTGKQVHLIDTPGYPDFIGNAPSALWRRSKTWSWPFRARPGIEVNTRRLFQEAGRLGLGRFVVVTKMDAENVDYRSDLAAIRETFGTLCVPFNVPVGQGSTFSGVVDVIQSHDEDPAECPLAPTEAYRMVVEQIVELDEDLMMRYLEGETVEPDELRRAAHDAIAQGKLVPVLCVCTRKDLGLRELLDLIATCGLSPGDIHRFGTRGADADAPEEEILPAEDGTLVAQVFKTVNDQFMGKLSYLRILSGRLASDTTLVNLRSGKTAKAGHIYVLQGKQQEEVHEAIAGDIVAIAKFDDLHVSDTISNVGGNTVVSQLRVRPIKFPIPMVPRAVAAQGARRRGQDLGGTGQDRRRRPDLLDPPRRPDARAGDLGHERPASGCDPAAAQEPAQAGDEHARAAGAVPRDDHGRGRGEPSAQEADRRPRPVRRGPPAGPAPRARPGLQLRQRGQGWRPSPTSSSRPSRRACASRWTRA